MKLNPLGASRLYHFPGTIFRETVVDPAPAAPAATPPEPAPAAPDPAAAAPPNPAAAPAPEPFAITQQDWEAQQATLAQLGGFVQQLAQPEPQPGDEQALQPPDPNLLYEDPAAYQQQLLAFTQELFGGMLDERIGQLAPMVERPFMASVEAEIHEAYSALPEELRQVPEAIQGDYFNLLQDVAATVLPQVGNDLGRALRTGAEKLRPVLDAYGKAAVEKHVADLETASRGGQHQDPAVHGAAVQGVPQPRSYAEIAERYAAMNGATGGNSNTQ